MMSPTRRVSLICLGVVAVFVFTPCILAVEECSSPFSILSPDMGSSMLGALDDALDDNPSELGPLGRAPFYPAVDRHDPSLLGVLPSTRAGNANSAAPGSPVSAPFSKNLDFVDRTYWRQGLLKRVWRDQEFLVTRWAPSEAKNVGFMTPLIIGLGSALSGREGGG